MPGQQNSSLLGLFRFLSPSLQKPPPFGHHRLPEFSRLNKKRMGLLRRKVADFLNCCKDWQAKKPSGSVDLRRGSVNGCGFYSRTSAVDRDERVREAVMYCKRTMTSGSL
ncbi:hypothetical protein HPP92_015608 [Vanilla planifolia]|uniref:Uncharacterized protein n=1 Tax=Vanilla planifolia TaxID=51239 RepID=A0A835QLH2_VANPL|nr:hypothetical protein HPP92_015608 [Vanilla planifolia]